jgi:nicotinamidase-related amidase
MAEDSPFWRSVNVTQTALLLSDVQNQLLSHMSEAEQQHYIERVFSLLSSFRKNIADARANGDVQLPLIIHHVVSPDLATMQLSPYNKINNWALKRLQAVGGPPKPSSGTDPTQEVPRALWPQAWDKDEFVLTKQAPSCFMSSSLLKILGARSIKHVILVGLTTEGSILSSTRHGADLDYHIIIPSEGVFCPDHELGEIVMQKLLPRFADVVKMEDIKNLFAH